MWFVEALRPSCLPSRMADCALRCWIVSDSPVKGESLMYICSHIMWFVCVVCWPKWQKLCLPYLQAACHGGDNIAPPSRARRSGCLAWGWSHWSLLQHHFSRSMQLFCLVALFRYTNTHTRIWYAYSYTCCFNLINSSIVCSKPCIATMELLCHVKEATHDSRPTCCCAMISTI